MRETKDQTINRLKAKVENLEAELKAIKIAKRAMAKDSKAVQMKTIHHNSEIIKEKEKALKELQVQFKKLRDSYHTILVRQSRHKYDVLFTSKLLGMTDDDWYRQIEEDNQKRLEVFNRGEFLDPYGCMFFFKDNLLLTINPHTGAKLNLGQLTRIYRTIRDEGFYLEMLQKVATFPKHFSEVDKMMAIDRAGRAIYEKLYSNFAF